MSISKIFDHPRVPCVYIKVLFKTVARWNISPEQLLQGSGVLLESLDDPEQSIDYRIYLKLITHAVKLTKEPGLGFFLGEQIKISHHGLIGITSMLTGNLREQIKTAQQFIKIQLPSVEMRFEIEGEKSFIYLNFPWLDLSEHFDRSVHEVLSVYLVIGLIDSMRTSCGQLITPSVDFMFRLPEYFQRFDHELKRWMEEVNFDQPYTRVALSTSLLDLPLMMADPISSKLMQEQCRKELMALKDKSSFTSLVRENIYHEQEGMQSLEKIAAKMSLSKRTLQRWLQSEGQNFNTLYEQIRKQKALQLIKRKDLSFELIAEILGYANSSSFGRAFKHWTGKTPRKYLSKD